jgi:hypothetical protein
MRTGLRSAEPSANDLLFDLWLSHLLPVTLFCLSLQEHPYYLLPLAVGFFTLGDVMWVY